MKINHSITWLTALAITAIFFVGCKKECNRQMSAIPASSADITTTDVNALAVQADNDFLNSEIIGGSETAVFEIVNDGLPDVYGITEATADEINYSNNVGNGTGFRKCLHDVKLSNDQIVKIKHLFKGYEVCNHSIIERHRHASKELLLKFNGRRDELLMALKNSKITKAQFEEKMLGLHKMYKAEREELAKKARAALKDCYTKMLRGLNEVLTEKQWNAFVNCYRH